MNIVADISPEGIIVLPRVMEASSMNAGRKLVVPLRCHIVYYKICFLTRWMYFGHDAVVT